MPKLIMRVAPFAFSTLALLAVQEAQQTAHAAMPPEPELEIETYAMAEESSGVEIPAEGAIAPPETLSQAIAPKPLPAVAPIVSLAAPEGIARPERLGDKAAIPIAQTTPTAQTMAASVEYQAQPTATLQLSQAQPSSELLVRPVAAAISYGDAIAVAEGDPLDQMRVGSYHLRSDRTARRETVETIEQSPDQYAAEIRSCLAARPALYRLQEEEYSDRFRRTRRRRILVPVLFDGQVGTLVGDIDGRPVCPEARARSQGQAPVNIPVQAPGS